MDFNRRWLYRDYTVTIPLIYLTYVSLRHACANCLTCSECAKK